MKRREFITLLGGAAAWPLAARAAKARPRIAVLSINSAASESKNIAAFVEGLRVLGHVDVARPRTSTTATSMATWHG